MTLSLGFCCGFMTARARLEYGMQVGLQLLLEGVEVLPVSTSFALSNLEIMLSRYPVHRQLHGSTSSTDRPMHSELVCGSLLEVTAELRHMGYWQKQAHAHRQC